MRITGLVQKIKDGDCEFVDFFPLNDRMFSPKNAAIVIGVYFGVIILSVFLMVLTSSVAVLSTIVKIISIIAILYSIIGIGGYMLTYMKYN